jgi:hypothetical protein
MQVVAIRKTCFEGLIGMASFLSGGDMTKRHAGYLINRSGTT